MKRLIPYVLFFCLPFLIAGTVDQRTYLLAWFASHLHTTPKPCDAQVWIRFVPDDPNRPYPYGGIIEGGETYLMLVQPDDNGYAVICDKIWSPQYFYFRVEGKGCIQFTQVRRKVEKWSIADLRE